MINYFKKSLSIVVAVLSICGIHLWVLKEYGYANQLDQLGYPLVELYLVQFVLSAVMALVVLWAQRDLPHQVGFIFLGLITLKFILNYVYIRKGIALPDADVLKYNYLITVVLFLLLDIRITAVVVNKAPQN